MRTARLTTEPFTCPSCVTKIEGALGRTPGVEDVSVLFNSNKVKVTFDEDTVSATELAEVVTGLGYPVLATKVA
ncbi:MAG TPA: heavy-metal-associated domain-containing protein [Intrasporangium sp.]|uniref:heavy-metal-associated domain-containing protein n=1 Tax=Intrasporangium sp. TaxID=1925024 RepID=UPI002B49BEF4|nr:heavy-metal-associated domain-containing protein [Intrasporangium sp.]HKX66902.1 heavy-metal-associated domain-containing protein [Intrasporangium sp.]